MHLQILCALCLAVAVHGEPRPIVSGPDSNLDFTGTKAAEGQFPHQISLRINGTHYCGGSILNSNWILTAAHCVKTYHVDPFELSVLVGTTRLSDGGAVHNVSKIIAHEDYDRDFVRNDVAVLKLLEPITFSERAQPIQLETEYVNDVDCVVSGWGSTSYLGNTPNELQFLEIKSISLAECKDGWYQYRDEFLEVFDTEICTFTKFGEGVCQGDSGGPLVANGKQIGIVSWGRACALGMPDVFTRVSSYYDWIQNAITIWDT